MKTLGIGTLILIAACILDHNQHTMVLALIAIVGYGFLFVLWAIWQSLEGFVRPVRTPKPKAPVQEEDYGPIIDRMYSDPATREAARRAYERERRSRQRSTHR